MQTNPTSVDYVVLNASGVGVSLSGVWCQMYLVCLAYSVRGNRSQCGY